MRDFGLFTALLVIACWVIDILLMPSALCIWSLYLEERENRFSDRLLRRMRCCKASASSWLPRLPRDLEVHLSDTSYKDVPIRNDNNTEFSSALTNVVEIPDISDGSEMREVGPYAREDYRKIMEKISDSNQNNGIEGAENTETSQLGSLPSIIQRFIYYYIAKRITQGKKACIIIFGIILTTTAVLVCTQLRTATKLPIFFGEGTNLQTLINIRYNITSDSNLDCFTCSGIFIPPMPRVTNPPPTTSPTTSPIVTSAPTTFLSTAQPLTTNSTTTATASTSQPTSNSTVGNTVQGTTSLATGSETLGPLTSSSPPISGRTPSPSRATTVRVTTRRPSSSAAVTMKSESNSPSTTVSTQPSGTSGPMITTAQTAGTVVTATDDPSINPCKGNCNPIVQPPAMDNTAIINVVFGIKGIDNTNSSTSNGPGNTEVS